MTIIIQFLCWPWCIFRALITFTSHHQWMHLLTYYQLRVARCSYLVRMISDAYSVHCTGWYVCLMYTEFDLLLIFISAKWTKIIMEISLMFSFGFCLSVFLCVRSGPVNKTSLEQLKLRVSNSTYMFPATVRTQPFKMFRKGASVKIHLADICTVTSAL